MVKKWTGNKSPEAVWASVGMDVGVIGRAIGCTTKANDSGAGRAKDVRIVSRAEETRRIRGGEDVTPSGWWWRITALNFAGRGRVSVGLAVRG